MVASDDLFPFYRICNGKVAAKRMFTDSKHALGCFL